MSQDPSNRFSDPTIGRHPYQGEVVERAQQTSLNELKEIIGNARVVQRAWAGLPIRERAGYVFRVRDYIAQHAEKISEVISKENGKTRLDAMSSEVLPAVMGIDYYAKHATSFLKDRHIPPGNILLSNKRSKIIRVPYGVIGVISPWNYPFSIPFGEIVPGLLAGNAVVLKAASKTQMVGRVIEQCLQAAKLPEGIFSYVNIPGRLAGKAFLQNGVDKLFYTGSLAVGKTLMKEASETLTPLVLELGGNDAMLVCDDADLHRAASGAVWAGLSNCGQSCGGVERIYVHEKVYDSFLVKVKEKVEALRVGVDRDFNVDMGVMTTSKAIAGVKRHLEDALAKGAVIYAQTFEHKENGSDRLMPGYVLTAVDHDMLVMKEETFGPILCVMKVTDMDKAIALANDSELGLSASVWSKNRTKAKALARKIQAGSVTINDHLMSHGLPETPWGGFKTSGIGRVHGKIGFDEFTQPQVIVDDLLPFARQNMWWFPHGEKVYQGLSGAIKLLYERSVSLRIKGLLDLLKIVPRYFTTR